MRALRINDAGLTPAEAATPSPGKFELLIRVCAAGIIPTELGWYPTSHTKSGGHREGLELEISNAVEWATAFYWKRVRCLQRSIVTTRLLRTHGVAADLVIGCCLAPFVGHAWVEVNGRVLVGPAAYPEKLQILDRA